MGKCKNKCKCCCRGPRGKIGPTGSSACDLYDAIVATSGCDFTSVAAAFAAGNTSVFVRDGTYTETSDINIPDGGLLIGESAGNVVINLFGAVSVQSDANAGVVESAGTISITSATMAVVGVGTSFTSLTPLTDFILIGQSFYQIAAIIDDLNVTLSVVYEGITLSAVSYIAQPMFTGVSVRNVTITGSTSTGLFLRGIRYSFVSNVLVMSNAVNIVVEDSEQTMCNGLVSENSGAIGLTVERCFNTTFDGLYIFNSGSHGVDILGGSACIVFDGCISSNNGAAGIFVTGDVGVTITGNCITNNTGDGIMIIASPECIVSNNTITGGSGSIHIDSGSTNCVISNNICKDSTSDGIDVEGAGCCVSGNLVSGHGSNGIEVNADNCVINSNCCSSNGVDGIQVTSDNCVVNGNRCTGNTSNGIELTVGTNDNLCTSNQLLGNIDDNLVDDGSNVTADNITS